MKWLAALLSLLMAGEAMAATKMYTRDTTSTVSGYKDLTTVQSSSGFQTAITRTVVGPTSGVQVTKTAGGTLLAWISCPLDAVTISGTITMNPWGFESATPANAGPQVSVLRYANGSEVSTILNSQKPGPNCGTQSGTCAASGVGCTEYGTGIAQCPWTATPTSTTLNAGDRIVVKWFINDANSSMTANNRTSTLYYDHNVTNNPGDTWVQFTENLTCQVAASPTATPTITPTVTRTATATATATSTYTWTPDPRPTAVAPWLFTDFSEGALSFWTTNGSPTTVYQDAKWWLQINPTTGTEYIEHAVAAAQRYTTHLTLVVDSFPSMTCVGGIHDGEDCDPDVLFYCPCTGVKEVTLYKAFSGTNGQALLALGSDRRLRVHWADTTNECTDNSLYRHTNCTVNQDCPPAPGGNPGEAQCSFGVFSASGQINAGEEHHVALITTLDTASQTQPYDATVSAVYDGGKPRPGTRHEGTCSGSTGALTTNGKACGSDADCTQMCADITDCAGRADHCGGLITQTCTTGGTCSGATLGDLSKIRVGQDTAGKAFTTRLRDLALVLSDTDPWVRYLKVVPLFPDGDAGTNLWTDNGSTSCPSHYGCVDDTVAGAQPDDDVTHLMSSTIGQSDIWTLSGYSPATGETAIAATSWINAKQQTAGNTATINFGLRDTGAGALSTSLSLTNSAYKVVSGDTTKVMPGGGALVPNDLRGFITYTNPGGSSFRARVTDFVAQVDVALPQPPLPNVFPDVNGNGSTLCIVGDSVMNDPELYEALNGELADPDNILHCAKGGQFIGDIEASWSNILDGLGTGTIPCRAERGQLGHCDVAVLHIGANNVSRFTKQTNATGYCWQRGCVGGTNAGKACKTTAADCPGGTCTDQAGPQATAACDVPEGVESDGGTLTFGSHNYCIAGDLVSTCCAGQGCGSVNCGGPGGCAGGANIHLPCTKANEATDCPGSSCVAWAGDGDYDMTDATYNEGWCARGSNRSRACPKGVCQREVTTAYMATTVERMVKVAQARTGSSAVRVVLAGNTDPCQLPYKTCVGGPNHAAKPDSGGNCPTGMHNAWTLICSCDDDSDCPNGVCRDSVTGGIGWHDSLNLTRWLANWMRAYAGSHPGTAFIDLGRYERRLSDPSTPDENLRDCIHQSELGQQRMADLISACALRDTTVPENLCGDLGTYTCPATLPVPSSTPEFNDGDIFVGSPWCVTTSGSRHATGISVYLDTVPEGAHARCSLFTLSGLTATPVNAGCDTGSVALSTGSGWKTLPTTTPANCTLGTGTYWALCNTDSDALGWRFATAGVNRWAASPYANGIPASLTMTIQWTPGYVMYVNTDAP